MTMMMIILSCLWCSSQMISTKRWWSEQTSWGSSRKLLSTRSISVSSLQKRYSSAVPKNLSVWEMIRALHRR